MAGQSRQLVRNPKIIPSGHAMSPSPPPLNSASQDRQNYTSKLYFPSKLLCLELDFFYTLTCSEMDVIIAVLIPSGKKDTKNTHSYHSV